MWFFCRFYLGFCPRGFSFQILHPITAYRRRAIALLSGNLDSNDRHQPMRRADSVKKLYMTSIS